jgi:hypothetical protein
MSIHQHARLTFASRLKMVRNIVEQMLAPVEPGVSARTARKWLGRYLTEGQPGLRDRSSRPKRSPR